MASTFQKDFPVPENFPQILHDFAREILRVQPKCIHKFGVDYFEKLLRQEPLDFDSKYNVSRQEQTAHLEYNKDMNYEQFRNQVQHQESSENRNENQQQGVGSHDSRSIEVQLNVSRMFLRGVYQNVIRICNEMIKKEKQQEQAVEPSRNEERMVHQQHLEVPSSKVQEEDEEKTLQTFKLKDD